MTPFDGEDEGERVVLSTLVKNTPPSAPSVLLGPEGAAVGQPLACDAQSPARDADQEALTLSYRWYRNDRPEPLAEGSSGLPAGVVRRGERWRCESWATDGSSESAHVSAVLTVRHSPPTPSQEVRQPERLPLAPLPHLMERGRGRIYPKSLHTAANLTRWWVIILSPSP